MEAESTGVDVRARSGIGDARGGTEEGHLARKRKARKTEARRVSPKPNVRGARFTQQLPAEKDAPPAW